MHTRIGGLVAAVVVAVLTLTGCSVTYTHHGTVTDVGSQGGKTTWVSVEVKSSDNTTKVWQCDSWQETSCPLLHVGDEVSFTSEGSGDVMHHVTRTRASLIQEGD